MMISINLELAGLRNKRKSQEKCKIADEHKQKKPTLL